MPVGSVVTVVPAVDDSVGSITDVVTAVDVLAGVVDGADDVVD